MVPDAVSVCLNCPFRSMCRPDVKPPSLSWEDFARKLACNARKARIVSYRGFGAALVDLSADRSPGKGWNCVEYSRAVVYSQRVLEGADMGYLLWLDAYGNSHLTPVRVDEPCVYEDGTDKYWVAGFTPVAVFLHPPLHWSTARLTEQLASGLPVLPPDESLLYLVDLGYGDLVEKPQRVDTGVAYVYRVRVQDAFGFLVWFKEGTPVLVSKDPLKFLATAHRTRSVDFGVDTFRF